MAEVLKVRTDKFDMEYCKFGCGKKVLVIIPGLSVQSVMGSANAIEASYGEMKDEFTYYVFDCRKDIPDKYSIEDMAADTAYAMKELGLKDAYLFGGSRGGMVAMTIAMEYPELVKKLALGSTSSHVKEEQRKVIANWIKLAKEKNTAALYDDFAKEIYPPAIYEQTKEYFAEVSKTVKDSELYSFIIQAEAVINFDATDKLGKINCPVLALGVFEDAVLDSDATMEIAEKLDYRDDFRLFMYTGYGHAAFDTAPDYRSRLFDFYLK